MEALIIFVGLYLGLLVGLVALGYYFSPKRHSEEKIKRFEAGGPPYGPVQRRLVMQYFGYIYLVTVAEATVGFAIVAALLSEKTLAIPLALTLAILGVAVARYFKLLADVKKWG